MSSCFNLLLLDSLGCTSVISSSTSVLWSEGAQDRVYQYDGNMTEQTHKTCCCSSPSTSGANDGGGGTLKI